MHLLIIGASGRVGRRVCRIGLERGHHIRGFSRSVQATGELAGIEAIAGDVADGPALVAALNGVDGVICSLGMDRGSDFPWARIRAPRDIHSTTIATVIRAMEERGPRRVVMVSAHGVGDSWRRQPRTIRAFIASSAIAVAYTDLARAEALLRASALDWTSVRPTVLTNGPGTGRIVAKPALSVGYFDASIPRDDVATFLVDAVEGRDWVGQTVSLTGA